MITLLNMIFANPQAYRVFPLIGNPYNTGITDTAIYTGYLQVTDGSGNTKSFSNTSTIDFTGFLGTIDIDQYTDTGSVKLGRWKIASSTVITNDITINITDIEQIPADGTTITLEYEVKYNTYDNGLLISSIVVTPDSYTLLADVEWITIDGENIVISANTDTEPRQGLVTILVSYQNYTTSTNYSITQSGNTIGIDIMNSMVLWYDLKKQGATNESMAENPVLRDLSGNGYDATCYNFAWGGMSGIGGYLPISYGFNIAGNITGKATIGRNRIHITHTPNIRCAAYNNGPLAPGETRPSTSFKVTGLTGTGLVLKTNSVYGLSNGITQDGIYTYPEYTNTSQYETYNDLYFDENSFDVACDITIEQLPLYPHALVSDGVDDYCLVGGLPNIHSLLIKYSKLEQISTGQDTSWKYLYNTEISGAEDNDRWYCTIRPSDGALVSDPSISDEGYAQRMNDIVTNNRLFRIFHYERDEYGAFALYYLLLFNRDLTPEEIEWVKTNLIETEQ